MRLVHLRCMELKNLWDCRPFCQQFIEFFNIKSRVTEFPPTFYSTGILPDSWPNLETGCLVARCKTKQVELAYIESGNGATAMQVSPVNLL